jgi:hypothetical protein
LGGGDGFEGGAIEFAVALFGDDENHASALSAITWSAERVLSANSPTNPRREKRL